MSSQLEENFKIISYHASSTSQELEVGLRDGVFDFKLIEDIAQAFSAWQQRSDKIKDPYCVWHWDGAAWSKVTKEMYQEEAYREWYRLTHGGRRDSGPKFKSYYYLGSSKVMPDPKHSTEESEHDDFSISYLLTKSFGE